MTTPESSDEATEEPRDTHSDPESAPSSAPPPSSAPTPSSSVAESTPPAGSSSRKRWLYIGGAAGAAVVAVVVIVVVVMMVSGGGGGASSSALEMISDEVETLLILDVGAIRNNPQDFPGDIDDFEEELMDEIESELDTREVGFDQLRDYVLLADRRYSGSALLITGNFAFDNIRDDWEDQDFEDDSYKGFELWDGDDYYALLEDQGAIFVSSNEDMVKDVIKILDDGSGSLADAEENDVKSILDKIGSTPAVLAIVDGGCDDRVADCVGYGVGYDGADLGREEITTNNVVLFSSERRAERAFDNYDNVVEYIEDFLDDYAEAADNVAGLPDADGVDVDNVSSNGVFVSAVGVIEVEE